jgi:hypothetical protein
MDTNKFRNWFIEHFIRKDISKTDPAEQIVKICERRGRVLIVICAIISPFSLYKGMVENKPILIFVGIALLLAIVPSLCQIMLKRKINKTKQHPQ